MDSNVKIQLGRRLRISRAQPLIYPYAVTAWPAETSNFTASGCVISRWKALRRQGDGLCFKISRIQYPIFLTCSIPLVSNKVNTYSVSRISAPYHTTDYWSPLLLIAVFTVTCTPKENRNPPHSVLPSKHPGKNEFGWSKRSAKDSWSH